MCTQLHSESTFDSDIGRRILQLFIKVLEQTLHLVNNYDMVHFCDNVKVEHKKSDWAKLLVND